MPTELRHIYPFRGFTFGDSEPSLEAIGTSTGTPLIVQDQTDNASNQVAIFRGGNRATAADGDAAYITHQRSNNTRWQWEYDAGINTGTDADTTGYLDPREAVSEE